MNRLRPLYFILANTAILTLFVVIGAHLAMKATQPVLVSPTFRSLPPPVQRNYAHMKEEDVNDLLRSTMAMRFRYAPAVGVVDDEMHSRFVNIDKFGVRSNGTPRPPSAINGSVWFFGGSTALGFGVADRETIPAQLEQILGSPVTNLGVRGLASEGENKLMTHFLRSGYRPSIAVFFDGINESCQQDNFQDAMRAVVDRAVNGYSWEFASPVVYAYRRVLHRLGRAFGEPAFPPDTFVRNCEDVGRINPFHVIHARLLAERAERCSLYGVTCLTFVQPFAGVHGKQELPGFLNSDVEQYMKDLWAEIKDDWGPAGAVLVTDALDPLDHSAYIDSAHYSAEASRLIAAAIAPHVRASLARVGSATEPPANPPVVQ